MYYIILFNCRFNFYPPYIFSNKYKGPYNKIMLHWDGLKIFIKLKNFTKVILN
jgi:hypothetical protein